MILSYCDNWYRINNNTPNRPITAVMEVKSNGDTTENVLVNNAGVCHGVICSNSTRHDFEFHCTMAKELKVNYNMLDILLKFSVTVLFYVFNIQHRLMSFVEFFLSFSN